MRGSSQEGRRLTPEEHAVKCMTGDDWTASDEKLMSTEFRTAQEYAEYWRSVPKDAIVIRRHGGTLYDTLQCVRGPEHWWMRADDVDDVLLDKPASEALLFPSKAAVESLGVTAVRVVVM